MNLAKNSKNLPQSERECKRRKLCIPYWENFHASWIIKVILDKVRILFKMINIRKISVSDIELMTLKYVNIYGDVLQSYISSGSFYEC